MPMYSDIHGWNLLLVDGSDWLSLSVSEPESSFSLMTNAPSFFMYPLIPKVKNGEVPGSELDTDEVPGSVLVKGVPSSGLLVGVTGSPLSESEDPFVLFLCFSDAASGLIGRGDSFSAPFLGEPTKFKRRTFA